MLDASMGARRTNPERMANDRRQSDRFPIERDISYRVLSRRSAEDSGSGTTINISSGGVLFTTRHNLPIGKRVEVSISWPAQLNDRCALRLVARGRVVRCEGGRAALEIQQYEFRTQATATRAAAPVEPLVN